MTLRGQVFRALLVIVVLQCLFAFGLYPLFKERLPAFTRDRDFYADIAVNLAAGRGFAMGADTGNPGAGPQHATMRRMPAFPLLLAALEGTVGSGPMALFLVHLALLIAGCLWIYRIGARFDQATGLLAMLLLGGYPLVMLYVPRAYSEILLLFFMCGALYALLRFLEAGRWPYLVAAAAMAGGAWLTRSTVALWLAPAAVLLLRAEAARDRRLRVAVVAGAVFALLAGSWIVRNAWISGSLVTGTTWNTRSALVGLRVMTDPAGERNSRNLDEENQLRLNRYMQEHIGLVDSPAQEVREAAACARLYAREIRRRPAEALAAGLRGFFRVFFQTGSLPMRILIGCVNLFLALLAVTSAALARVGKETAKRRSGETATTGEQSFTPEAQRTQRAQRNPEVFNPQSAIRNSQLEQSAIRNPQSAIGTIRNPQFLPFLWWLLGTHFVFYSLVYPLTRYLMAAVPALALLAALGAVRLARRRFGSARVDAFTARL
jgi:hypothetical protein